jgi:hypothetical protein
VGQLHVSRRPVKVRFSEYLLSCQHSAANDSKTHEELTPARAQVANYRPGPNRPCFGGLPLRICDTLNRRGGGV